MAALLGVSAALAFVLAMLALAMRALRRLSGGLAGTRARVPMEVVQRIAVGPRQGIAVVRIGEQVIAVSVGEGGVRPLTELAEADRVAVIESAPATLPAHLRPGLPAPREFRQLMRGLLRSAALLVLLCVPLAVQVPAPALAQAGPGSARAGGSAQVARAAAPQPADPARVEALDAAIPRLAPQIDLRVGDQAQGGLRLSGTVGVVVMIGLLTLLPTLLLLTTSFTRILIVLHFLRQALGTQNAPPAHLIAALALLLTGFVMAPTFGEINRTALEPWMAGRIEQGQMLTTAAQPLREFMLAQTREGDLETFLRMSSAARPTSAAEIPLVVLTSAFVTSELRTAFQIGFALFLPFIIIDLVVASVLMSMGMFMLPPAMIALPFKLLLFVLVDGWSLVVQGLVASFR